MDQNPYSSPTLSTHQDNNFPIQGEFGMINEDGEGEKNALTDAVQLVIEEDKRKIREEIIASEIIRRQQLEAEVRLELMMEEQIMGMRRFYGGSSSSSVNDHHPCMLMNSSNSFGFSGFRDGSSYFPHNLLNVGSSDDGLGNKNVNLIGGAVDDGSLPIDSEPFKNNSNVFGEGEKQEIHDVSLGKWPFERDPNLVAAQIAVKSVAECGEEEVLGQAMPSSGISVLKRKAETSVPAIDEETASVASKDSQKKKWYCSLCGVSATSAGGLNLHLHGKKHKAKEAGTKSGDKASNISVDSLSVDNSMQPMEQVESHVQLMEEEKGQVQPVVEEKSQVQPLEEEKSQVQLIEEEIAQVQPMEGEKRQVAKKWECSLCQLSLTSEVLLKSHLQGKKHKAKEAKLGEGQGLSGNNGKPAKEKSVDVGKWYCSLCQVSAASEKNLNDHFQGKKHKGKAESFHQDAGNVDSDSIENISKDVKEFSEKSMEGEEGLKSQVSNQEIVNTVNIEGDEAETDELENNGCDSQEMNGKLVKLWHCKMCNEGTYDEATMANHRKSRKHMNLLREIGGGLIVVSNVQKEAVEGERGSQDADVALE